ncbi:hypothetical protein SLEP1_g55694 [Rubroshorea leprosula]|nr:hypothetical protein SLEP1_g55694 [Rubroshorea leprosula]
MALLVVFCTNFINIHAGLNGLEVGQTVVIAFAIMVHNIMQIGASSNPEYQHAHAFSICLLFSFLKCPRHRLPRFNPETGLLTGTPDCTLVNFYLRIFGPKSEKSLCIHLLIVQAVGCCFCFLLRYLLAGWYK